MRNMTYLMLCWTIGLYLLIGTCVLYAGACCYPLKLELLSIFKLQNIFIFFCSSDWFIHLLWSPSRWINFRFLSQRLGIQIIILSSFFWKNTPDFRWHTDSYSVRMQIQSQNGVVKWWKLILSGWWWWLCYYTPCTVHIPYLPAGKLQWCHIVESHYYMLAVCVMSIRLPFNGVNNT